MDINEFRGQYPQYADVPDAELAQSLHQKFYSDVDYPDFLNSFIGPTKATDYLKSAASGALSGAGMIAQGGGELLARGVNAVAPSAELRSVNPFQGAIDWLEESKSPGAKRAEAESQITGSIFDDLSTWNFGTNPTMAGIALQGVNAIGQFAPNLAIALVTAGASVPAQLTIGATVGGLQALGGGAEEERTRFSQMGPDELMASSALYRTLTERGVSHEVARDAVGEAAAIGGGMGNALPSAAEGAFENFLIGAMTKGKFRIPGKTLAGRVAIGATGGAALGGTEEAVEQVGQNIGSNIAIGGNRPLTADTLQQFVMGAIAEGAAGAGGGAVSHVLQPAQNVRETAQTVPPKSQQFAKAMAELDQAPTIDAAIQAAAVAAETPLAVPAPMPDLGISMPNLGTAEQPNIPEQAVGFDVDTGRPIFPSDEQQAGYVEPEELLARMEDAAARGLIQQPEVPNAVPEQSPGALDVRNAPANGEGMGVKNAQPVQPAAVQEPVAQVPAGQPHALTDEEIARQMTASIPADFRPQEPLSIPTPAVTIMGAAPDKLTTPELRVSSENAAKPEQRQAAKTELDRRVNAYRNRSQIQPDRDSLFMAIAKFGGLNKKDALSSWGIDPADVKGLNPMFGKPLLRTTGGLSIDGMAELLIQDGYLDQRDLVEFERKFKQELAGKPVMTPQGYERQAAETAEPSDEHVASLELTPQDLSQSGYDKLSNPEQEQVQAILDALVQYARGKPYETLVDAVLERAIVQTEGRPFMEYARNVIAQIQEVIKNAESTDNQPAQTVSGARGESDQGAGANAHQEGRAAAIQQVAGAELALTGQTAAEVKAEAEGRARAVAAQKQLEAAPPAEEFTLAGSSRPADQARARGQKELAPAPNSVGTPPSNAQHIVQKSERPYRDTPKAELVKLAHEAEGDTLTAVEDELNLRSEEKAAEREARLAAGRVAKKATIVAKPATVLAAPKRFENVSADEKKLVDDLERTLKEKGIKFSRSSIWYSELARTVSSLKQETAPAAQWKMLIANLKGVKKDELEWTGINEWLDLQQGKVTKQKISDYLLQNGVKVEETVLGDAKDNITYNNAAAREARLREDSDAFWRDKVESAIPPIKGVDRANLPWWAFEMVEPESNVERRDASEAKARAVGLDDKQIELLQEYGMTRVRYLNAARETSLLKNEEGGRQAKFSTYTLPGGKNYRELLLTLPEKEDRFNQWEAEHEGKPWFDALDDEERAAMYAEESGRGDRALARRDTFRSSHFDQPNILAHVRFNERTDAEGKKVLFIEEIQSDWAQKGKLEGFKGGAEQSFSALKAKIEQKYGMSLVDLRRSSRSEEKMRDLDSIDQAYKESQQEKHGSKVPPAPFVGKTEAWVSLAMKRMIRYAAENGFDRVAWTTGEQQTDRYDLSRVFDNIAYRKGVDADTYEIRAFRKDDMNGIDLGGALKASELPNAVGKDVADRIIRDEGNKSKLPGWSNLSGLQLKVGGEGMRSFYDKIVTNVANDVLKKLGGGRVGDSPIVYAEHGFSRERHQQPGFDITHALREKAMQGMALFSRSGRITGPVGKGSTSPEVQALNDRLALERNDDKWRNAYALAQPGSARSSIADAIKAAFGKDVVLIQQTSSEFSGVAGMSYGGKIYVNVSNEGAGFINIVGHELLHEIKRDMPHVYDWFSKKAEDFRVSGAEERYRSRPEMAGAKDYDVQEEMLADFAGDALADPEFLKILEHDRPGMFKQLLKAVVTWLNRIAAKLAGNGFRSSEYFSDVNELRKYLAGVLEAYAERGAPALNGEAPKFSRNAPAISGKTTGDFRDSVFSHATEVARDYFTGFDKLGWWQKSVGTPFHLAMTNAEFRPFFDKSQMRINDVSRYANEAADLAPALLPRVEKLRDVLPKFLGGAKSAGKEEVAAVSKALYAGTLYGGGNPMDGRVWSDEELRTGRAIDKNGVSIEAFKPLNPTQISIYHQALAAVSKQMDEIAKSLIHRTLRPFGLGIDRGQNLADVAEATKQTLDTAMVDTKTEIGVLKDRLEEAKGETRGIVERNIAAKEKRIEDLTTAKHSVADIAQKAADLNEKGYFPAMRFGRYALQVVQDDKQVYFGMYENKLEAALSRQKLAKSFPGTTINGSVMPKEKYRLFQGLSMDALEAFADHMPEESRDPLLQAFIKAASSERSVMKRHLHRSGLPGYNEDIPRSLASFVVSGAQAVASNYHDADLLKIAQDIKSGDISDYATKIARYLMDPMEEAQALRGFLFMQFLGGSIASGLVNMTQPAMVTAPWLAQHTSYADAVVKLGKAAAENAEKLTGKIGEDFKRAKREGIVAPQEIHQLRAETGGGIAGRSLALRKLSFAWGSIFAATEQFNRKTTFLAAYRIAEEKKLGNPYAFAKEAVDSTQFLYNKANRPVLSRGPIGATLMTFKQFTISYLEMAKRLYDTDKTAFALLTLTLLAAGGLEGLPFAEDIEDIVDTLGQWMGYATNSKKKVRQWAMAILGPDFSQIALRGVSGLPWMPFDVSARMGMANLIPGTSALKPSEKNKTRDVVEMLGPAGQFLPLEGTMLGNALERVGKGDIGGAIKAGAPKAIQAAAKGVEQLQTGQARDIRDKKITTVTPGEAVLQMAGLNPAGVARESQRIGIVQQDIDLQNRMKSEIAEQWARGIVDREPDQVKAARKKLADWNTDNPELRIHVDSKNVLPRIKELRMTREERFVRHAPKEIRREVREALR